MPVSVWRRLLSTAMAAVVSLAACGSAPQDGGPVEAARAELRTGWFGGYLDATLLPGPSPQAMPPNGTATTLLAFISSDPARPCEPSWGGSYDLGQADHKLGLDAKVDALRRAGTDVALSFGGQRGTDLAVGCTGIDALVQAYAAVISRYGLDTVDLDVEGAGSGDDAAVQRRAAAMARLQAGRPPDAPLKVWLTLPVSAHGLTPAGVASVEAMFDAGVELSGVNIMTMNFGPLAKGQSMLDASIAAAEATHRVLGGVYARAGQPLDSTPLWGKIGLTPMIGRNDVARQVFGLDDAKALNTFAVERGVGRVSMWSLNRDTGCNSPRNEAEATSATHDCSGVDQEPGMFAKLLGHGLTGTDAGGSP
ncbi:MAG: chitinase [Arthrobacter sp.]